MTMWIPIHKKQKPRNTLRKVPELRLYISHSCIWLALFYGLGFSWFSSSSFILSVKLSMFWIQPAMGEPVIELRWLFWKVDSLVIIFNRNEIVFPVCTKQCNEATMHYLTWFFQHTSLTANLIGYTESGLKDIVLKSCVISLPAWLQRLSALIEN